MRQAAPVNKTARYLSVISAIIILLLPLHAFLTIWLSSLTGHYTLLRLWKEFLLVPVAMGAIWILLNDPKLLKRMAGLLIFRLIIAYALLLVVCAVAAYLMHDVSAKAMLYGLLVDLRFLIFFMSVMVLATRSEWLELKWQKVLFIPAILVGAFAVLQFLVLPNDFLRHFGYGPATISPYETINHNINHIRVESTLRGANPLGAYLILPISVLTVMFFRQKKQRFNITLFASGLLLALIFSFSRSAWIGVTLSLAVIAWFSFKSLKARKIIGWWLAGILIGLSFLFLVLRNNLSFENAVFHTDRQSTISVSSNEGHADAFKSATRDIIHRPLGSGIGSAGPQSVYNDKPARIAENYFLQIGQEAGVLGMTLFIAICFILGKMLYERRADPLALALFASLVGLTFVNLLSHAWTDDTLAYTWWGLAAIALAPVILTDRHKRKNG